MGLTRNGADSLQAIEASNVSLRQTADDALVAHARAGDSEAFAQLIEPRTPMVLRTARGILGNDADAADVTQEVLTAIWVHLPSLRDPARFDAWLHRVLMNRCRDHLRHRRRSRDIELTDVDVQVEDHAAASISSAAVLTAFDRLRLDERQILILHHLHGMPLTDLARQLGVADGTAKSRLHAARQSLQRALEAQS